MKERLLFEETHVLGELTARKVFIGTEIVAPTLLSIEEFEQLSDEEQRKYLKEVDEYNNRLRGAHAYI